MSASHMQPLTVAATLHRYRLAAGYTQEELAERAGISARSISDIERGVSKIPHADTMDGLADALGLSPEERATLHAAARAHRSLGTQSAHGDQESLLRAGVRRGVPRPYLWKALHVLVLHRPVLVGVSALILIAAIAFVTTRSTNAPTSTSTARAFVPFSVAQVRPVVLGLIQAFATDRNGNLYVGTDDAMQVRSGLWKVAPSGQVLGHWNRYGRVVVHGDDVALDGQGNA